MYSFSGQGVVSQKPNSTSKKTLRLALKWVKNCQSGLLLVALGCSAGQILVQEFAKFDHPRQFLQGKLFLLAVCTHEVPLYLCSIFCSRSLAEVSTMSYRVLSMEHAPNCIPHVCVCVCVRTHAYVRVCARMCVCACVCVCMCACVCSHE